MGLWAAKFGLGRWMARARIRGTACREWLDAHANVSSSFDFVARQIVGVSLLVLMSACSAEDSSSPDKNQELIAFGEHVQGCRATVCQNAFPLNQKCRKALEMIREGRPKVKNQSQYIRYLQNRLLFSDTYADWLEGETGKSVMGRQYCQKNLKFIGDHMDGGG